MFLLSRLARTSMANYLYSLFQYFMVFEQESQQVSRNWEGRACNHIYAVQYGLRARFGIQSSIVCLRRSILDEEIRILFAFSDPKETHDSGNAINHLLEFARNIG